jgi:DNA-binding protein Fis
MLDEGDNSSSAAGDSCRLRDNRGRKATYKYGELTRVARDMGICRSTLSRRVHQMGLTLEQAVAMGVGAQWSKASKLCGIPAATLRARMQRKGLTLEEAMARPYKARRRRG